MLGTVGWINEYNYKFVLQVSIKLVSYAHDRLPRVSLFMSTPDVLRHHHFAVCTHACIDSSGTLVVHVRMHTHAFLKLEMSCTVASMYNFLVS